MKNEKSLANFSFLQVCTKHKLLSELKSAYSKSNKSYYKKHFTILPILICPGYYWVDPNAGVKLDAIQVYCDFKSKKIYTCVLPAINIVSILPVLGFFYYKVSSNTVIFCCQLFDSSLQLFHCKKMGCFLLSSKVHLN